MRSNISVKFFLRKTQQKKNHFKIYGRIHHNRVKSEFATDIFVLKEDWNEKFCRSYNDNFINERLSRIEALSVIVNDAVFDLGKYKGTDSEGEMYSFFDDVYQRMSQGHK